MEIVLEKVFTALKVTAASSGPDIAMFKRLKEQWAWIDQSSYSTAAEMVEIAPFRKRNLQFAAQNLKVCQPRRPQDDFREFLELDIIFLGGTPARGIRFLAPGTLPAGWHAFFTATRCGCSGHNSK